jgi:hypothetical protein
VNRKLQLIKIEDINFIGETIFEIKDFDTLKRILAESTRLQTPITQLTKTEFSDVKSLVTNPQFSRQKP